MSSKCCEFKKVAFESNRYGNRYYLGSFSSKNTIDFKKCYDIKTQDGEVFEGCEIFTKDGVAVFMAKGLRVLLGSDMMIRVNHEATAKKERQERQREIQKQILNLKNHRKEVPA